MPQRIRSHIVYPAKQQAVAVEPAPPAAVNYWTDEEDAYVRKCYPTDGSGLVARALGRTAKAVQSRASFLGISCPRILLRA